LNELSEQYWGATGNSKPTISNLDSDSVKTVEKGLMPPWGAGSSQTGDLGIHAFVPEIIGQTQDYEHFLLKEKKKGGGRGGRGGSEGGAGSR